MRVLNILALVSLPLAFGAPAEAPLDVIADIEKRALTTPQNVFNQLTLIYGNLQTINNTLNASPHPTVALGFAGGANLASQMNFVISQSRAAAAIAGAAGTFGDADSKQLVQQLSNQIIPATNSVLANVVAHKQAYQGLVIQFVGNLQTTVGDLLVTINGLFTLIGTTLENTVSPLYQPITLSNIQTWQTVTASAVQKYSACVGKACSQ